MQKGHLKNHIRAHHSATDETEEGAVAVVFEGPPRGVGEEADGVPVLRGPAGHTG